jgi:CheY-like chemotaxis protein
MLAKPVTPSTLLDACLEVLLPMQPGSATDESDVAILARQRLSLAGARLLLVEDNPVNQELACELLRRSGIEVMVADNGVRALEMLERQAFDGVLMDCQMPELDGYEATRRLRQDARWAQLPVIAMTANAMAGDRQKVLEAGMNDHVAKPIRVDDMFATLARWVRPAAPAPAPDASPPSLDMRAGVAAMMGDEALYRRLLAMFFDRETDFVSRFRTSYQQGDGDAATRCAHDLKSVAGSLGMPALQRAAAALEEACNLRGEAASLEPLLQAVQRELAPVLTSLREQGLA